MFIINDGNQSNLADVVLSKLTLTGGNSSNNGGGIDNRESLTLTNSTLFGNTAFHNGGGISNFDGTLIVINSTISGNSAGTSGGGIFNDGDLARNQRHDCFQLRAVGGGLFNNAGDRPS